MKYVALLRDLDALLRETLMLWDPGWVTFNWRGYTYDHIQRVRGLALTLAAGEGADLTVVELAALLHDITKSFDGEILVDAEGQRVLDERGYWQNETRDPPRRNHVVDLYEELGLRGLLHNESGALLAEVLLQERDVSPPLIERVAEAIREHLRPSDAASKEAQCLYDADTIDANIGLPAFVRNIYINLHFHDRRKTPETPPIDQRLTQEPLGFLHDYIRGNLPRWVQGKRQDFPPRLCTATARKLAEERLVRLEGIFADLADELPHFDTTQHEGRLAVVLHYMHHRDDGVGRDVSIAEETAALASDGLAKRSPVARTLVEQIQREIDGEI